MKVVSESDVRGTAREVPCPKGGFISLRYLLEKDGTGFSFHRTLIPKGPAQRWHYKHHLEACYCVSGRAILRDVSTNKVFWILPGTLYALDKNDKHTFRAIEDTELICIFNPPIKGRETHQADGSYRSEENE